MSFGGGGSGGGSLSTDSDVSLSNPIDGNVLAYNGSLGVWQNQVAASDKTLLNGTSAPGSGVGVDGDFYIDTAASRIYGPKTSGAWGSGASLVGAQGAPSLPTFTVPGTLMVKTSGARLYIPQNMTITSVRASVGTASSGASVVVDVNKNGTTIFTTQSARPTVTAGSNTATSTPAITSLQAGDYLSVDVDQVGSTTAGADLVVQVTVA